LTLFPFQVVISMAEQRTGMDEAASAIAGRSSGRSSTERGRAESTAEQECKENGPRAIWLIEFWCLMINTTCGLICLLVFIIIVHRMRRELDQGNEDATPQKKT
jgi:hypothetical protein